MYIFVHRSLSASVKKPKSQTLPQVFNKPQMLTSIKQKDVDDAIVDHFVSEMIPLRAVESKTFQKLINTTNPTKNSMSRRTLTRRIGSRYDQLEKYLIE